MTLALPIPSSAPVVPWEGAPWQPRTWQRDALPIVIEAVRRREFPVVSAATGSGKSKLIAELAWVAERKAAPDRVVVVSTPTQNLVRQLASTIAERRPDRVRKGEFWTSPSVGQFYGQRKQLRRVIVTCNPSAESLAVALAAEQRRAGLMIVDECHGSEADRLKAAITALAPSGRIGLTATPFRSSERETLRLWTGCAYRYSIGDAIADGVLVPPVGYWPPTTVSEMDAPELDLACIDLILAHADGPGIVSASDIDDATAFAARLVEAGIPAAAIHSKLPEEMQDARIGALKRGELRALVHVAMLSEGVDLPWLRWLCMRRPVSSRVRIVQEVGRVLRVDYENPAKVSAAVMDPHGLLTSVGLQHPDSIGENPEPPDPKLLVERKEPDPDANPRERRMPPAQAVDEVTAWLWRLMLSLQIATGKRGETGASGWRTSPPSDKQIAALHRMKWATRYFPEPHRTAVKAMCTPEIAGRLTRGACSDLLSCFRMVADASQAAREQKRHWTWPASIPLPAMPAGTMDALPEAPPMQFAWRQE